MNIQKKSLAEIIAEKKAATLARMEAKKEQVEAIEAASHNVEEEHPVAAPAPLLNPTTPSHPEVIKKLSLAEILAAKKHGEAIGSAQQAQQAPAPSAPASAKEEPIPSTGTEETKGAETFSLDITLNEKQLLAKEMAAAGKSFCLVGAAGTGKTTAQRETARSLLETGILGTHTFRIQGTSDYVVAPSIAFVAYTRVASGNLRRAIHKVPELEIALKHNITTIHNLLEYTPETCWDYEENKEKFGFVPRRTKANPLDITHLVIEEASMVGLDLWEKLYAALRPGVQIIFIGDINQLPPVFGDSILNYALVQLPVIELTHVYRQAGDSGILDNAHRILKGHGIEECADFKMVTGGNVQHTQTKLSSALGQTFPKWAAAGEYDPLQDIILSPWNKRELGTDNMNKWIAQFLGTQRQAVVHEIIAGVTKLYLAEGDKVMYNKQVGVITSITRNGKYIGRAPLPPSVNLNRFGTYTGEEDETLEDIENMDYTHLDLDKMMEDDSDRVKEASHHVKILLDDGGTEELTAIGDYSPQAFSLAYALTVHKAQGCEWRKVFFILHRDHSVSLCRELLYTAVTRAREKLVLIAKPHIVQKAIEIQKIKGNTTQEKIEYFNSGIKLNNAVYCTK